MAVLIAHLLDMIASLVPTGLAATVVTFTFKMAMHAIDDKDRWNRFLTIAIPAMVLVFALAGFATYWLIWDHGAQLLLQLVGHAAGPATSHHRT